MADTRAARYEIRRAQPGDAAEMARLGAELGYPLTVAEVAERLAVLLLGRELVEYAEAWGRSRGLAILTVRSNVARELSHPFYEALGYSRDKTQHVYSKALTIT